MEPDEFADRETERWHASPAWKNVDVDDSKQPGQHGVALMSMATFDFLNEYSCSLPSGTFNGKRWKRLIGDEWFMGEYIDDPDPERIGIRWREIYIRDLFGDGEPKRATETNLAARDTTERLSR